MKDAALGRVIAIALTVLLLVAGTVVWDWLAWRECLEAGNSWLFCARVLG